MNDWEKIKGWILDEGYIPQYITLDELVGNILLSYQSDLKSDDCSEESWVLEAWFETLVNLECFDYKQ